MQNTIIEEGKKFKNKIEGGKLKGRKKNWVKLHKKTGKNALKYIFLDYKLRPNPHRKLKEEKINLIREGGGEMHNIYPWMTSKLP